MPMLPHDLVPYAVLRRRCTDIAHLLRRERHLYNALIFALPCGVRSELSATDAITPADPQLALETP